MSEYDFDILVLPLNFLRNPPFSPLDGKPYFRADAARVEELIAARQTLYGKDLGASRLDKSL